VTDKLTQRLEEGDNLLEQEPTAYQNRQVKTNEAMVRFELLNDRAKQANISPEERKVRIEKLLKELGL
jgi:hypothetical protein